jgi:DNA-binding SARP family transcriptional activator/WD40 repeat protein
MEFRILGPLQVEDRGMPVALGGAKQRTVLALMLLDANHVVSVDRLVDGVWGERPPARAASTLQVYVANLRKVLEPGRAPGSPPSVLLTQAPGYQLVVQPQQLDLTRFEALATEGRKALEAARPAPASVLLREGLSLWRGRPLEDLPGDVFGPGDLARLEEMRIGVIEDRVEADLASGRHGEVVGELESLVARYPFRERLGGQWMLALYRAERQADALAAFRTIRDRLVEELGVEPGAELRSLESAILAQDPALSAPSAVPLDAAEVERLLLAATGRAPDPGTVERIRVDTGGNASAVEVAVRHEVTRLTTDRLAGSIVEAGVTSSDLARATETAAEYVLAVQQSRRAGAVVPVVRPLDPEGTPPAAVACPYKGLMRYDAEDAVWFHGRERLSAELLARLGVHRFVGVVGASGSGKSSLVRAGLLAAIREGALPASESWPCALLTPGRDPIDELARALAHPCGLSAATISARLDAEGVPAFGALLRDAAPRPGGRFVVVVDQFEEVFTLCDDVEQRALFLELLATGVADADSPLSVVIAVRADYYGRLAEDADLAALLTGGVLVGSMERDELRRAIEEPARIAGLVLDPNLVDRILLDVADEPGALPLLSTALVGTWERRRGATLTVGGYDAAGGVHGALARLADDVYERFEPDEQRAARDVFLRLAEPGQGTDDVRRRAPLDELVADDVHADVLTALVERRLVVTGEHTAEVAHEALLREWPRLREWLQADREARQVLRRLALAAADWDAGARDADLLDRGARLAGALDIADAHPDQVNPLEREFLAASRNLQDRERVEAEERAAGQARQNRRLRALLTATAIVLVLAIAFGGYAVSQRTQASSNANRATAAQDAALARGLAAKSKELLAANTTDQAMLLAVEAQHFGALTPSGGPAAAEAENALLRSVSATPSLAGVLPGQDAATAAIGYSPDGSRIVSMSNAGDLRVWDAATRHPLAHQPPAAPGHRLVGFAVNDAGLLATSENAFSSSAPRIWDLSRNRQWRWQPPRRDGAVFDSLALSDRGVLAFASASWDSFLNVSHSPDPDSPVTTSVDLYDVETGTHLGTRTLNGFVNSVAFSPDGSRLAVQTIAPGGATLDVQLLDPRTGALDRVLQAHHGSTVGGIFDPTDKPFFSQVLFSKDGRQVSSVAARSVDGAIATFDVATGAPVVGTGVGAGATVVGVAPDLSALVITASGDDLVTRTGADVIDARTGAHLASFPLNVPPINPSPIAIDPNHPVVVYQSGPGALAEASWARAGAPGFVDAPAVTRVAAESTLAPTGAVIDLSQPLRALGLGAQDDPARPWRPVAGPSGEVAILTGSEIAVWDPASQRIVRRLTGVAPDCADGPAYNLAFGGDRNHGRVVLACGPDLQSWDLAAKASTPVWHQPWTAVRFDEPIGPRLSPDGTTIAYADSGGSIRLADAATGRDRATGPSVLADQAVRIGFSPDGRTLAVVHWSGDVDLLDTGDASVRTVLKSAAGTVVEVGTQASPAIGFSPDSRYFVSFHDESWQTTEGGFEIWDTRTGESVGRPDGRTTAHFGALVPGGDPASTDDGTDRQLAVHFAEHGDSVTVSDLRAVANGDGVPARALREVTWSLRPADWAQAACRVVGHDMTRAQWAAAVGSNIPYHRTCSPMLASAGKP